MLSLVKQEKSFITSGPGLFRPGYQYTNEKKACIALTRWNLVLGETIGVSILTLRILIDSFYWSDTINLVHVCLGVTNYKFFFKILLP